MLTISAEIKRDGKRLDGTYNVKLRFTLGRKVRRNQQLYLHRPKILLKTWKLNRRHIFLHTITKLVVLFVSL